MLHLCLRNHNVSHNNQKATRPLPLCIPAHSFPSYNQERAESPGRVMDAADGGA